MRKLTLFISLIFVILANEEPDYKIIYQSINPRSISKHLAFYQLYKDTSEGKNALNIVLDLLSLKEKLPNDFKFPKIDLNIITKLINGSETTKLHSKDLNTISSIGNNLPNRKLSTYNTFDQTAIIESIPTQIDLSRAILLLEFEGKEDFKEKIKYYETVLDLMAFQILTVLPPTASDIDKINAINNFIFFETGIRYPPLSTFSKKIEINSVLHSVIDRKKGICLGTSILYLCLAQRLNLDLEIVTPPGHIYVRYKVGDNDYINIETTARGVNVPTNHYLGLDKEDLKLCTLKETIGLISINEASDYLNKKDYNKVVSLYEKAQKYLPNDKRIKELLGIAYLLINQKSKGITILNGIKEKTDLAEDILIQNIPPSIIEEIFSPFENKRKEILEKKKRIENVVKNYPNFRAGLLLLASLWAELDRTKEALQLLERVYELDQKNIPVNFNLCILSMKRYNFAKAWFYLNNLESLFKEKEFYPPKFLELKKFLNMHCLG